MTELGITPASRSRVTVVEAAQASEPRSIQIEFVGPGRKEPKPDLLVSWMQTDSEGLPS